MKAKRFLVIFTILLLLPLSGFSMDIKTELLAQTITKISNGEYLINWVEGKVSFENTVEDRLDGVLKLGFRYYNSPISETYNNILLQPQLAYIYSIQPLELYIYEAYLHYKDFIIPGLDLSIGKQRIAWGTADVLNPTDVLNPLDFSNPLKFGEKYPTFALNLQYSPLDLVSIQIVAEPYSGIARLNPIMLKEMEEALYNKIVGDIKGKANEFYDDTIGWSYNNVILPEYNITNGAIGIKVNASVFGFDISANLVRRTTDIPIVKSIYTTTETTVSNIGGALPIPYVITHLKDRAYELGYYKEWESGIDFSKDIGFMVLWGEVGAYLPDEFVTYTKNTSIVDNRITDTQSTNIIEEKLVTVTNRVYFKYTIGGDKKIGSWYFNVQFAHGFFTERFEYGDSKLQDYLTLRVEKTFLNEKLKVFFTGIGSVNTLYDAITSDNVFDYVSNNYGLLGIIGVQYKPISSLELTGGIIIVDGKNSTLEALKDFDSILLEAKWTF